MKKIFSLVILCAALCACEEFSPVTTFKYGNPAPYEPCDYKPNTTIAELVKYYNDNKAGNAQALMSMTGGKIIAGRVSTTDQPGNFYKSLYIQDETGGIEVKIGKNGLYNDFKEGQMVYVDCDDLAIGAYGSKNNNNGMVQIGFTGEGTDYETSYMELPFIIDNHVLRGDPDDIQKVEPVVIGEYDLPTAFDDQSTNHYIGKMVTLKGLTYGGFNSYGAQEVFALLYLNSNADKKASSNRIFVSGTDMGVTTWAMSKEKMSAYLESGMWDSIFIGNSGDYTHGIVGDPQYAYQGYKKDEQGKETWDKDSAGNPIKTYPAIERAAYSVSQYFSCGNVSIAIRTSGYCKFADTEIPAEVLAGTKTIDVTGVLTLYEGAIQIVVNNIDDIKIN